MDKSRQHHCIFCATVLSQPNKPEHILLNALGGRLTTRNVICDMCNHEFGIGPDQDLAESVAFIRNMCSLNAGDGHPPPPLNGFESDGISFRLDPGMQPKPFSRTPLTVNFEDDEINVQIEAYSDKQAEQLLEGAARKIAKKLGHSHPNIIEAIKADLLKDKKSTFRPGPSIRRSLQFGEGRSQQAKAKACLVFWAHCVGTEELQDDRYSAVRSFARFGITPPDRETLIKIDMRALPPTPAEFGENPNIIWVGSNDEGKAYGYFRLYGAIGWRFLLCEAGAPPNLSHSLISNPLANQTWKVSTGGDAVLRAEWVFSEWSLSPLEGEKVADRLQPLLEYAKRNSQNMMVRNLTEAAFAKAGPAEGDQITEEHATAIASYVSRALTAYLLKVEIPEE